MAEPKTNGCQYPHDWEPEFSWKEFMAAKVPTPFTFKTHTCKKCGFSTSLPQIPEKEKTDG